MNSCDRSPYNPIVTCVKFMNLFTVRNSDHSNILFVHKRDLTLFTFPLRNFLPDIYTPVGII